MENYRLELSDGTVLNCTLNGNNYIANGDWTDKITQSSIINAKINGAALTNPKLLNCRLDSGNTWFIIGEISEEEQRLSDIEEAIASLLVGGSNE